MTDKEFAINLLKKANNILDNIKEPDDISMVQGKIEQAISILEDGENEE